MGTILVLAGSPRKEGHTQIILKELAKGAQSRGGVVKTYDLNDPDFRGCQGCFYCRTHPACSVNDVFSPFYADIEAASGVVFASPIYFGDISGQAKTGLDRLFPMLDGASFSPRFPGKKFVSVFAQGDGNAERFAPAIARLGGFLQNFGWKQADTLVCAGVSAPGFVMPDDLLKRAFAAGSELAG